MLTQPPTQQTASNRTRPLAVFAAALISACGGGGGGGGGYAPASPGNNNPVGASCATDRAVVEVSAVTKSGHNLELALRSCAAPLASFEWRQTAGPAISSLLGARSAALSVEPPAAGSYGFEVRYVDELGTSRTANATVNVAGAAATEVVVRGDPVVWGYSTLSARAWLPALSAADAATARFSWTQISGPTLALTEPTNPVQIIQAPVVQADTTARLRAVAQLADGRQLTGEFNLLIQPPPAYPQTNQALWGATRPVSAVFAYKRTSPYAAALSRCVYHPSLIYNQTCTMRELPLLGTQTQGLAPTVEQVMDRVLVSHEWMGEVFERYLREQDTSGDLRRQLASTTAVVIGARVRPAFYWVATGAIYLDAANLWLTPEQRDTLSEAPDPRSAFGLDLAHTSLWRYVKNNQSAAVTPAISQRLSRPSDALVGSLTRLMYHELTHAADFTPPSRHLVMNLDGPVSQSARSWGSERLQSIPLRSSELSGVARVRFFGDASTATQRGYTPEQVGELFAQDVATDFYSYAASSGTAYSVEDTAMLLEEALMQVRHGVLRDVAVTAPILSGQTSAQVLVRWGQRGRVGDARIRPRVQIAANELMPWLGSNFASSLGSPTQMRAGASWQDNLNPATTPSGASPEQAKAVSFAQTGLAGNSADDAERIAHLRHLQHQTELVMQMRQSR